MIVPLVRAKSAPAKVPPPTADGTVALKAACSGTALRNAGADDSLPGRECPCSLERP